MSKQQSSPVIASLPKRSQHPYSSISMSPTRQYAVIAVKDTLRLLKIEPSGLSAIRSVQISQHFQTAVADNRPQNLDVRGDVRDTFSRDFATNQAQQRTNMAHVNVGVTCVAWSVPQHKEVTSSNLEREEYTIRHYKAEDDQNTIVAAAGSNGTVVVWKARHLFFSEGSGGSSTVANQQPEAVLNQHSRSVNTLSWHPKRPGLLLTASQDATAKLWERREVTKRPDKDQNARSWFGFMASARSDQDRTYSWFCRATFDPKSEAVRDIQWSSLQDDIFAIVTVSGSLIVYNMHIPVKAVVKVAAHAGDATSVDWHPSRPFIIATGGSGDRFVKVWDLENSFASLHRKEESNVYTNQGTMNTVRSENSTGSFSSSETERSGSSPSFLSPTLNSMGGATQSTTARTFSALSQAGTLRPVRVLSISSSVTRLRWRPPANDVVVIDDEQVDRHDAMLAVATARLTSAGGSGVLSLWTLKRPYMPLSVVEGHGEGAVSDFVWVDTPQPKSYPLIQIDSKSMEPSSTKTNSEGKRHRNRQSSPIKDINDSSMRNSIGNRPYDNIDSDFRDREDDKKVDQQPTDIYVWQHVLSVGRDGHCFLQSFARGDRPISRVPPTCFALANLSPFQRGKNGYGSLQIFQVNQKIPSGAQSDFYLAGLRRDKYTANAPGVFKEVPDENDEHENTTNVNDAVDWVTSKRLPATVPDIVFNVVDTGDLDSRFNPVELDRETITIAPEVVHLSRFAKSYKFSPDERLPTRVDVCFYNGDVAERLRCEPLARMWRSIASMLNGSGRDELPSSGTQSVNAMQFILLPTIKNLLEERANAGDVQTCVALCEVLQVIQPQEQIAIPGLELSQVREWYLSYIDLLHQMCLFSIASFLIRNCKDPFIGALNQQSTTMHEACPRCGKPLQPSTSTDGPGQATVATARQVCKNCRRRVGLCFICHEPVKGMFVWCPGCGHGGHLDHALQWFGGLSGKTVREVCPTGCGHKCNLSQPISAFPRTDSLHCLPVGSDNPFSGLKHA